MYWLKEKTFKNLLQAIGGDSTLVNTGWKESVVTYLEKKL